jgi:membrane-associated phospholipid phosphatase
MAGLSGFRRHSVIRRARPAFWVTTVAVTCGIPGWSQATDQRRSDPRDANVYVGQASSDRSFVKKLAGNILLDQKDIWTSPFHIDRSSAKWWILAGVGTAALLAADHQVSQELPTSGGTVRFGTDASRAGQWYSVFLAGGALYGLGLARSDRKLEETGALSLEALADADIVTNVMKVVAQRQRPLSGDHGGHFEKGGSSFPSSHSTQAWALATVIASEYGDHKWVPYASYGYASLVSTSRVLAQAHFTSDVFVGGAIGFFIGRYVVRTQKRHSEHLDCSLRARLVTPAIMPSFSPAEHVLTLVWTY